jgi:hypothetical protein
MYARLSPFAAWFGLVIINNTQGKALEWAVNFCSCHVWCQ